MSLRTRHWALLLTLLSFCGYTHAAFITDKIEVGVYAQPFQQGARLGTISTGTQVEVLSSDGAHARVRSGNNLTGWIPTKYLSDKKISSLDIKTLQRKTFELEAELKKTRSRVKQLEATLQNTAMPLIESAEELELLRNQNTALEQRLGAVLLINEPQAIATNTGPASTAGHSNEDTDFLASTIERLHDGRLPLSSGWFIGSIISAIIIGIIIGFTWLDKRIRRRHGGFRLY